MWRYHHVVQVLFAPLYWPKLCVHIGYSLNVYRVFQAEELNKFIVWDRFRFCNFYLIHVTSRYEIFLQCLSKCLQKWGSQVTTHGSICYYCHVSFQFITHWLFWRLTPARMEVTSFILFSYSQIFTPSVLTLKWVSYIVLHFFFLLSMLRSFVFLHKTMWTSLSSISPTCMDLYMDWFEADNPNQIWFKMINMNVQQWNK